MNDVCASLYPNHSIRRIPPVRWAQRKDKLYIKIDVQECKSPDVKLSPEGKLSFKGTDKDGQKYALDMEFLHEINVEVIFL